MPADIVFWTDGWPVRADAAAGRVRGTWGVGTMSEQRTVWFSVDPAFRACCAWIDTEGREFKCEDYDLFAAGYRAQHLESAGAEVRAHDAGYFEGRQDGYADGLDDANATYDDPSPARPLAPERSEGRRP